MQLVVAQNDLGAGFHEGICDKPTSPHLLSDLGADVQVATCACFPGVYGADVQEYSANTPNHSGLGAVVHEIASYKPKLIRIQPDLGAEVEGISKLSYHHEVFGAVVQEGTSCKPSR